MNLIYKYIRKLYFKIRDVSFFLTDFPEQKVDFVLGIESNQVDLV